MKILSPCDKDDKAHFKAEFDQILCDKDEQALRQAFSLARLILAKDDIRHRTSYVNVLEHAETPILEQKNSRKK